MYVTGVEFLIGITFRGGGGGGGCLLFRQSSLWYRRTRSGIRNLIRERKAYRQQRNTTVHNLIRNPQSMHTSNPGPFSLLYVKYNPKTWLPPHPIISLSLAILIFIFCPLFFVSPFSLVFSSGFSICRFKNHRPMGITQFFITYTGAAEVYYNILTPMRQQ